MDGTGRSERIVSAIIKEMSGRKGLGDEWGQCDPEIQQDIRDAWAAIVQRELEK